MSVKRCRQCRAAIEWLLTVAGKRVPFNHELVPAAQASADAWAVVMQPIKGIRRAVVIPFSAVSETTKRSIRWVLIRHECRRDG